jgi:endonuclease YncB( thermonuclease family)
MGNWTKLALMAAAIVLASSCTSGTGPESGPVQAAAPASSPLLMPADGGDGDSWHDTAGAEYRLGLVNTPEYDECYGPQATAKRKELTAHGFRADVYTHDVYGRGVATVTTANGVNVNVYLARYGYANDKYLSEFRHENPTLAAQLDTAFAKARAERLGLWSACYS